jgi:hypothetical protein
MSRIYTAQFNAVAATVQQDLFEIVAPATAIVIIHDIQFGQTTELGDAQEEGLLLLMKSGQTTTGSGGSAPAKVPAMFGNAASGATVAANNTTKATTGTIVTHGGFPPVWNIRVPYEKIWTPECRPIIAPSRRWTFELASTPADSITISGSVTWEEIG